MTVAYCKTCDHWVTGYTLDQTDFINGEIVEICGFCGNPVTTYDEEPSGWEYSD